MNNEEIKTTLFQINQRIKDVKDYALTGLAELVKELGGDTRYIPTIPQKASDSLYAFSTLGSETIVGITYDKRTRKLLILTDNELYQQMHWDGRGSELGDVDFETTFPSGKTLEVVKEYVESGLGYQKLVSNRYNQTLTVESILEGLEHYIS